VPLNRLAIAPFNDARALKEALDMHIANQFTIDDLALAGRRTIIAALWRPLSTLPQAASTFAPLFLTVEPLHAHAAQADLVITRGRSLGGMSSTQAPDAVAAAADKCLLTPQLQTTLSQHMLANDVLLFANATRSDQHACSVRSLLQHGQGQVQSHIFRPPETFRLEWPTPPFDHGKPPNKLPLRSTFSRPRAAQIGSAEVFRAV